MTFVSAGLTNCPAESPWGGGSLRHTSPCPLFGEPPGRRTRGLSFLSRRVSEGRSPDTPSFERSELLPRVELGTARTGYFLPRVAHPSRSAYASAAATRASSSSSVARTLTPGGFVVASSVKLSLVGAPGLGPKSPISGNMSTNATRLATHQFRTRRTFIAVNSDRSAFTPHLRHELHCRERSKVRFELPGASTRPRVLRDLAHWTRRHRPLSGLVSGSLKGTSSDHPSPSQRLMA